MRTLSSIAWRYLRQMKLMSFKLSTFLSTTLKRSWMTTGARATCAQKQWHMVRPSCLWAPSTVLKNRLSPHWDGVVMTKRRGLTATLLKASSKRRTFSRLGLKMKIIPYKTSLWCLTQQVVKCNWCLSISGKWSYKWFLCLTSMYLCSLMSLGLLLTRTKRTRLDEKESRNPAKIAKKRFRRMKHHKVDA